MPEGGAFVSFKDKDDNFEFLYIIKRSWQFLERAAIQIGGGDPGGPLVESRES